MSKSRKKHQKLYKMKGCAGKTMKKQYLGGTSLAYTGEHIPEIPNPFLAYTGKGGASCGLSNPSNISVNTNAARPAEPNTGPVATGNIIYNSSVPQLGGDCGSSCTPGFMAKGGANKRRLKHRSECKCSGCKKKIMKGGNIGIPYPNGLVGSPWTPKIPTWPGVDGIPGNRNFLELNTYNNDVSRRMVDLGSNPPFLKGGKKQRGGTLSNFLGQDLINLGRQFQFGVGSAYNALAGYSAPVNPLPWKDQIISKGNVRL